MWIFLRSHMLRALKVPDCEYRFVGKQNEIRESGILVAHPLYQDRKSQFLGEIFVC